LNELDMIIADSLSSMFDYVLAHSWRGEEAEAVSLFAFEHLVKRCGGSVLQDMAQVDLGVWLQAPEGIGAEQESRQDLVIWPAAALAARGEDRHTAHSPLAVMEWKVSQAGMTAYDLTWLRAFSDGHPNFVGYAVCLSLGERASGLRCDRVNKHSIQPAWFSLNSASPD